MLRTLAPLIVLLAVGCGRSPAPAPDLIDPWAGSPPTPSATGTSGNLRRHAAAAPTAVTPAAAPPTSLLAAFRLQTLREARAAFTTKIVKAGKQGGPADDPRGKGFELIRYESPVGSLAAYVTPDPGDGKKHPAIVWIRGGDCNSIGDVWSPRERDNDQSASPLRKAGIVMMFPSLRGGNDNPGRHEGFFGEVDDILAATDHLARLPYVDPGAIFLGGHSTGGTMAMLVAECSDRYRAVFSLGPVATAFNYGGNFVSCDPQDDQEMRLRSPFFWMHCVTSPMYVIEGDREGNWEGCISEMAVRNQNPQIRFLKVAGHDHFSVIAPVLEKIAAQVVAGKVDVTERLLQGLR